MIVAAILTFCLWGTVNAANPVLDKVIIAEEYTLGLGGMMIVEFRPYLLFKDGAIMRSPRESPADLDTGRSRADQPKSWGRYRIVGGKIQAQWGDGKSQSISKWWAARPAKSGARLSGLYRSTSGGGNTALGGGAMVVSGSRIQFNADGSFSDEAFGGGSNSSTGVSTAAGAKRRGGGSYRLDGYTIELKTTDGRAQRLLFFFFPDSEDAVGVGSQVLSKKK
jgi:hypothetical protein